MPLSSHTHSCLLDASFVLDCYALAISSLCNENELVTYEEAQSLDFWMAVMQSEYDAIIKNGYYPMRI